MKQILESSEVFMSYAQIDYCYYAIENILKELGINNKRTSLEALIDKACSYNQNKEKTKEVIGFVETIIENKKKIEADFSADEKTLEQLKELLG